MRRSILALALAALLPSLAFSQSGAFSVAFPLVTEGSEPLPPTPVVPTPTEPAPPPPPPLIEELPPISSDLYLYNAVQQSPTFDRFGGLWMLLYPIRNPEPGPRLGYTAPGTSKTEYKSGRLGNGPQGAMAVGCDALLYIFIYDENNKFIQHVYRVTAFPGPPYAVHCDVPAAVAKRTASGWKVEAAR